MLIILRDEGAANRELQALEFGALTGSGTHASFAAVDSRAEKATIA
jgi:hypothetical protein